MQKIIFFDIDQTLFNRKLFLENFNNLLISEYKLKESEVNIIKKLYEDLKLIDGYFIPQHFLNKIYENFPVANNKLELYFQSDNLAKFLFEDINILSKFKNIQLGIFSKGEPVFQRQKIATIEHYFDQDKIYIFPNKLEKLPEVINKNTQQEIYLVDDNEEVLLAAKKLKNGIVAIQISRNEHSLKNNNIDFQISNLFDIISILND